MHASPSSVFDPCSSTSTVQYAPSTVLGKVNFVDLNGVLGFLIDYDAGKPIGLNVVLGSFFACDEAPEDDFNAQRMDTDGLETTCCTWDPDDPWQPAVVHLRYFIDGTRLSLPMYTCCSLDFFALVPAAFHQGSAICESYAAAASPLEEEEQ